MTKHIGEVTLVKTNIETGEVTEYTQKNTQFLGLFRNLSETTGRPYMYSNNSQSMIYISDNIGPYNRLSSEVVSTVQTFNIGGAAISGEYWPQYSKDTTEKRGIFTFKQRFAPGTTARVIKTIALYAPAWGQYFAGLELQTYCNQSTLEILDIYYKVYVYYDAVDAVDNYNTNTPFNLKYNVIPRWVYSSGAALYAEGTTSSVSGDGRWYDNLSLMITDSDLRDFTLSYSDSSFYTGNSGWSSYIVTPSARISNNSQGSTQVSFNMATTSYVGSIFNKVATPRWNPTNGSSFFMPVSASYILGADDSRIQSVYLKSADSVSTNFAYLDPSTIGSSTAAITFNDVGWTQKWRPSMFKVNIVQGGNMSTAKYTVSIRNSFGFANNFFSTEQPIPINNIARRQSVDVSVHNTNSYAQGFNSKRIDNRTFVTSSPTGITIADPYLNNFKNYDTTSTPALNAQQIQDAIPMPDGSILITSLDKGLMKLSADRSSLTQFTGIGSGVSDNICYAAAVKHNGDIWAMFEGGIAKYTTSNNSWVVYNTSTPITFTASAYNPNWSNTLALFCRKDAGGDAIALFGYNNNAITWWSPSSPTAVVTSGTSTLGRYTFSTVRADFSKKMMNVPGSTTWYFVNNSNTLSRMVFGTNTATAVGAHTMNNLYPIAMNETFRNGEWTIQTMENPSSSGATRQIRWYNATGLVTSDTNLNTYLGTSTSFNTIELMDEYGTAIMYYTSSATIYQAWLHNILTPLSPNSWRNYGWNSTTNEWDLNGTEPKPVHTTMDNLPDGLKCSFTPTGANDFISNERWIGYITDGLHKDNSTTATIGTVNQGRNYYYTTDLSSYVVPSSLGTTTENVSAYTLGSANAYSWNGAVSAVGYNSNAVADALKSELVVSGDFTFTFKTTPYAGNTNTSYTTSWIGFYENSAITPTSKWAFRFNNAGYMVTEDDVSRTTAVAMTSVKTFTIKRVGSTITYLVDGVLLYTSTITSANPLRCIIRMPSSDNSRTYFDMSLMYNETRPAVRIGDAVNQTGVYDTRYAMIEAWSTSPRTATISLNGVPATIVTDPDTPLVEGQVLLLQKSGLLVFHPSDVGKTITCNAMVLLET